MENPYLSPKPETSAPPLAQRGDAMSPFGLRHFFIWLGFSVTIAVCSMLIVRLLGRLPTDREMRFIWVSVAWTMWTAAGLTGALELYRSRSTRGVLVQHPGHCLILVSVATELLNLVGGWLLLINASGTAWLMSAFSMFVIAIFVYSAFRSNDHWRWIFAVYALVSLIPCLSRYRTFSTMLYHLTRLLDVSVVVVSVSELATKIKRDWVHWLGIVTYALGAALPLWLWIANALG